MKSYRFLASRFSAQAASCGIVLAVAIALDSAVAPVRAAGELTLQVVDAESGETIPCRMHITNEEGKPQKVGRFPNWRGHFVFPGKVRLKLDRGTYYYIIERGPEYNVASGHFIIETTSKNTTNQVELKRAANLAEENWWSGDLHVHRPLKDIELLMKAEDLHVAPVITWSNARNEWAKRPLPTEPVTAFDGNRYYDALAGEDERAGGTLLFFRLDKPLELAGARGEYPSPAKFIAEARQQPRAWIDAAKPFDWDLPLWLAGGLVDSIGLCNDHLCRDEVHDDEAGGKPRNAKRFPPPMGNALWSQQIYHHVLNSGFRIPPSAGSASGERSNPLGYNRIYVWVDRQEFSYDKWWEGFKEGRVVVTNGPLIRPLANGRRPGHVFTARARETVTLDVRMSITVIDPVSHLEIIQNGLVAQRVPFDQWLKRGLPLLHFDESGWFLVRAVTDREDTYRFASSAPWYVVIGDTPNRIEKQSVKFFLD
ncbi:MAG TPA: hypothetical protein VGX78_22630, partial [Pirellulales bacterium]|nr:hypothetical protein [Pirellulales bacterium]